MMVSNLFSIIFKPLCLVLFLSVLLISCTKTQNPSVVGELSVLENQTGKFVALIEGIASKNGMEAVYTEDLEKLAKNREQVIFINFRSDKKVLFTLHNVVGKETFRFYLYKENFSKLEVYQSFYSEIVGAMNTFSTVSFKKRDDSLS